MKKKNINFLKKFLYPGFFRKKMIILKNRKINDIATNFFPTTIKELKQDIINRKFKAIRYFVNLKKNKSIKCIHPTYTDSVHLEYFCLVKKDFNKLYNFLLNNGIYLRKHWYRNNNKKMKNCSNLEKNSLLLPTHNKITNQEINYISNKINEFYKKL